MSLPPLKRSDQELLATLITARVNAESIEQLRQVNPAYADIEQLFVYPQEYEDICSKLDNQNLVCIAGEPHMGKTFTAIRVLCDYARRGYRVRLGLGASYEDEYGPLSIGGRYRWSGYRDERDLDKFVKPGQISYIEDPYGISDEDLDYSRARFHLGILIDKLNELPSDPFQRPPKIIITMRRAILENILPEYPSLLDHVIKLQETSYTTEDRRAILDKYIEWIKPSWSEDEQTRQKVLPMVPDELVAPHNIYWLVSQTRRSPSLSVQDVVDAKEIINALTTELSLIPELEQLVFVSIYVTNSEPHVKRFPRFSPLGRNCYSNFSAFSGALGFNEEHARETFEKVVTEWSSMIAASGLSTIGTEFQHLAGAAFLHDSYAEAVGKFIRRNATKGIFAELASRMLELINEDETRNAGLALAYPVVTHFESVRSGVIKKIEPLLKSEDKYTRQTAAEALLSNYQQLPEELKNLIDELDADTDCEMWRLIMRTAWPNHQLSHEDQIALWEKALLGGTICPPDLVLDPLEGLLLSYRSLSPELKGLIRQQLGSDDQYTWYCYAAALVRSHKHLPREMQTYLHKLAEHGTEPVLYEIIHAISLHYDSIPDEIRAMLERYVNAPSWKLRAYVVAAYHLLIRKVTPEHTRLIEHHVLHDPDARVRLSYVYIHLHLSGLEESRYGRDVSPDELRLFDEMFFSEVDIDKAGVLFSLFHTYNEWKTCKRTSTYRERLKELLYDSTPLVMAMINLKMQDDYPNDLPKPPAIRLDDSLLDALRNEVQALAEGLVHICYGPLSGQQS